MDRLLGPDATGYLTPPALESHESLCREGAMGVFDAMATMGRRSEILRVRALLLDELDEAHVRCACVPAVVARMQVLTRGARRVACFVCQGAVLFSAGGSGGGAGLERERANK